MNGAEATLAAAVAGGVDVCFANPGTTEMPFVAALDSVAGIRAVLGLQENVCTGAADGYARLTGRPALTLLHLGPGLANGIANLHNARRARSPVVNLVGEHATWHRAADPPLTMDIEALARTVSGLVRTSASSDALGADLAEALAAAARGQIVTLVVAHDHQLGPASVPTVKPKAFTLAAAPMERIEACAAALRGDGRTALLLGGAGLHGPGLDFAGAIAAATGADLYCDTFPARVERGAGRPRVTRLPYFPEQLVALLGGYQRVVIAGTRSPVSFFGYEGQPSELLDTAAANLLAGADEDVALALGELAGALSASGPAHSRHTSSEAAPPGDPVMSGALDAEKISAAIAGRQPEGAIIVETAATTGLAYYPRSMNAPAHTYLALTGGAIGQGPACAVGAALACPQRKVINFQADGSAAYTVQALWTQARESLDVVTVICANRRYAILQLELMRAGIKEPGPNATALTDLSGPVLDWVKLAGGFGVPGVAVDTADALDRELARALAEPGPRLIEAIS